MYDDYERKCFTCGSIITHDDFFQTNEYNYSDEELQRYWEEERIELICCYCFHNKTFINFVLERNTCTYIQPIINEDEHYLNYWHQKFNILFKSMTTTLEKYSLNGIINILNWLNHISFLEDLVKNISFFQDSFEQFDMQFEDVYLNNAVSQDLINLHKYMEQLYYIMNIVLEYIILYHET